MVKGFRSTKSEIENPKSEVRNQKKFAYLQPDNDLVAQPVEQLTLNQWVESSILSQVTIGG
jgi:hypothetical protein